MVRLVFISDTHTYEPDLPDGDILIHTGDGTYRGNTPELEALNNYFKKAKKQFEEVVYVPGNHELELEESSYGPWEDGGHIRRLDQYKLGILSEPIVLIDRSVEIKGITFYGTPYQPEFHDWAFNLPRNGRQLEQKWKAVPTGIDVLATHSPPHGILDRTVYGNQHVGCELLTEELKRIKPAIHAFGHIHEDYGWLERDGTLFINASTCTLQYKPTNKPIIVDVEKRDGKLEIVSWK